MFANDVVGWRPFANAGFLGSSTVIGNVEAGHIWSGHEAFVRPPGVSNGFTIFQNTNALNELDFHATMVGHVLAGSGYNGSGYSYLGLGMAPEAAVVSGSVATSFSTSEAGAFSTSYESVVTPYRVFFTGEGAARADVINSSWGGYDPAAESDEALALDGLAADNRNTALVVAAGNSAISPVGWPASGFNNIGVGSLGGNNFLVSSGFSSRGLDDFYNPVTGMTNTGVRVGVDVSAPGEVLYLAAYLGDSGGLGAAEPGIVREPPPTDLYFYNQDGTSFSAPIVAGGIAVLKDVANRDIFWNLTGNTNAQDTRVTKSVVMAGALETYAWDNAQIAGADGVVSTTMALDAATGAGSLDLGRSASAYFSGTRDVDGSGGGGIADWGWDFGAAALGSSNDYFFSAPFSDEVELTVSLNWFARRSFDMDTNLGSNLSFADLNLEVWEVSGGLFSSLIARSETVYNNSEYLRLDLGPGKTYGLRVTFDDMVFDQTSGVGSESYGLAWLAQPFDTLYWDSSASTNGTWSGQSSVWNTSPLGSTNGTAQSITTAIDRLVISSGSNAAVTVLVDGSQLARGIHMEEGTITLGGTNSASIYLQNAGISLAASSGGDATIGASVGVMISGSQTWSNASTHNLNVSGAISGSGDLAFKTSSTGSINISGGVNHAGLLANNGSGSGTNTISGVISTNVTGVLQDSSTSMLVLNGSVPNQYTGDTTVRTGTLVVDFANATAATNLISSDSRLVLGGAGGSEGGTLRIQQKNGVATSQTFDGTLVASGGSVVEAANVGGSAGAWLTVNLGAIARTNGGTVAFLLPEFGSITTANANVNGILGSWATVGTGGSARYAAVSGGAISALAGTVAADASQITDTTGVANYDLAAGGSLAGGVSFNTLRFTGSAASLSNNFTANGILNAGSGPLDVAGDLTAGDARNLVVNASSGGVNVAGAVSDNSAGSSAFTKAGAGIVLLSATNSYTGNTYVNEGRLVVDGSITSSAHTFVTSGGVLGGHGTVGNLTLQAGGTGSPGNSPGTQTVAGNLEWAGGANYNWDIYDAKGTAGNLLGWDLYDVTGQLDLTALSLMSKFNINLWSLSAVAPDVSGDAINFDYAQNYTWTIVAAAGGIAGFNADFFNINTAAINGTGGFSNDTLGGYFGLSVSGNNLNLTFTTAVPEPGTWLAGGVLLLAALAVRYRRGSSVSRSRSPR